jgi:hypothetical protein
VTTDTSPRANDASGRNARRTTIGRCLTIPISRPEAASTQS